MPRREDDDPLVAVILDCYDYDHLDASIENAARSGAAQIYILSAREIKRPGITLLKTEAISEGDAMRDLDGRQIIRSDFILFRGECDFELMKAVEEHKARRKLDKDVIMTLCCSTSSSRYDPTRPLYYIGPGNRLLHYGGTSMPNDLLSYGEIDIRADILPGAEICSIDVPPLFSENFDYQSFDDFYSGILTSDLLDSKFYLRLYRGLAPARKAIEETTIDADASDEEDEESISSIEGDSDFSDSASATSSVHLGDINLNSDADDAKLADFEDEARASLERALHEGHSVDNAAIELKTLRMATNVGLSDVRAIVVDVLFSKCPSDAKLVPSFMSRWAKLITLVSSDDEVDALCRIQSYCSNHSSHTSLFIPLLKLFYNDDIFEEESIVSWWRSDEAQKGAKKELRDKAQNIIRYILESSDDEDD